MSSIKEVDREKFKGEYTMAFTFEMKDNHAGEIFYQLKRTIRTVVLESSSLLKSVPVSKSMPAMGALKNRTILLKKVKLVRDIKSIVKAGGTIRGKVKKIQEKTKRGEQSDELCLLQKGQNRILS